MLYLNYPNPFNPSTTITYDIPEESYITLSIFDLLGRDIATLIDTAVLPGHYSVSWNGNNNDNITVANGVYLYRLNAKPFSGTNPFTASGKLVIVK